MISVLIEAIDKIKKNDKAGAEWKESALQPSVTLSRLMSDYQMKSVTNKNNPSDDGEEDYEVKIAELWSRKVGKFRLTWFALKTWQIWYFPRESWGENTMGGDFFIDAAALQWFSGDSGVQLSIHTIRQPATVLHDDNFLCGGFTSTLSLGVLSWGIIGQLVILLYSENLTVFFPFGKDQLLGFRNPRATKVLLTNQIAILQFV